MKTLVTFYILLAACFFSDAQSAQRVIPNSTELIVDPSWRITAVDGGAFFKLIDQDSFKKWVISLAPSAPVTSVNGQQGAVTVPVFDSSYDNLKNKPVLFSGAYADLTGKPVLFSGNYNDLSNKPSLAPVATSGSYNDLTNKPTIPAQNVYNNGAGIGKTGTEPNVTFYVDTIGKVMTVSRAADSIQSLKNDVNGKVPNSRTLRIIGATPSTAQTLNNDITWTLPTIPAQLNATAGTNMSITGTYPNLTFNATSSASVTAYSKSALLSSSGVFITDTFSISSSTPTVSFASILSTAGKSNFKILAATGFRASGSSPQVSVTALTNNSATFAITQANTATVQILGINVLSGLPLILVPDPTNVKLILSLIAY